MSGIDKDVESLSDLNVADKVEDVETLKKNYADSTREAIFLAEKVKVLEDNTYLATIAKNDKKLAERISMDKWWISLDEALGQLEGYTEPQDEPVSNKGSLSKDELDKWYEEKESDKQVKAKFNETIEKLWLEEWSEDHKKFMDEYNLLSSGKKLTPELVSKFAKLAFVEIKWNDVEAVNKAKAIVSAQTISASPAGETSQKEKISSFIMEDNSPKSWYK